jgi:hypothetical protein
MRTHVEWTYEALILDLGYSWRCIVSFTLLQLYCRWKTRRYPLYGRLSGPQYRSGRRRVEKNRVPTGTFNSDSRPSSAQPTALSNAYHQGQEAEKWMVNPISQKYKCNVKGKKCSQWQNVQNNDKQFQSVHIWSADTVRPVHSLTPFVKFKYTHAHNRIRTYIHRQATLPPWK